MEYGISRQVLICASINERVDEIIPLGCMQLNPLEQVEEVISDDLSDTDDENSDAIPAAMEKKPSRCKAFDIDNTCLDGRVCFLYVNGFALSVYLTPNICTGCTSPQIWFQDLSCSWHFIANTFTDYFRLMVMHLGLPHWQYAFTDVGLDLISQQWFRFLSPERLAIDIEATKSRANRGDTRTATDTRMTKLNLSKISRAPKYVCWVTPLYLHENQTTCFKAIDYYYSDCKTKKETK